MAVPVTVEGYIDSFIQARWVWDRGNVEIRHFGLHTPEGPETPDYAENLGKYFATTRRIASTHHGTDSNSTVRYAKDSQRCAAAKGVNSSGIHVEMAGRAGQGAAGWRDTYSQKVLRRTAALFALYHREYGIPVRILTEKQLKAGKAGIVKHVTSDRVFGGDHWDPGPGFPDEQFLAMCREEIQRLELSDMASVDFEDWNKIYNALPEGKPDEVEYHPLVEMVQVFLKAKGHYGKLHGRKTRQMGEALKAYKTEAYGFTDPKPKIGATMWADMIKEMWD